ncbi:MAG: OmpH family outer membrane protein, partial [Chthoniobacterales bacterium]
MTLLQRKVLLAGTLALLAMLFLPRASEAQLRIGTVDVNRVFQSSAKTKEAEAKINEAKSAATSEFNVRADAYKKAIEEVTQLNQQLEAPAFSAEAKTAKAKVRDDKIAQIKTMEREITQFRQTREQELQQQMQRAKEQIVRQITDVV